MILLIQPSTLQDWLKNGACIIIDVREDDEFAAEHIKGAKFHPLSTFPQNFVSDTYAAHPKIVFQCRSGKRSDTACRIASELMPHHTGLYNLEGGILAWKEAGLPTQI